MRMTFGQVLAIGFVAVLCTVFFSVVLSPRAWESFSKPFFGSLSGSIAAYKSAHNWTLRIYFATWYKLKLTPFRDAIL